MKSQRVLGKGLSALIQGVESTAGRLGDREVKLLPIEMIGYNPNQPRKKFDTGKLAELSESIKQVGVLQPVLVRKISADESVVLDPLDQANLIQAQYSVVAGERRVRAARIAKINEIPAIVCTYEETEALKVALLENIQREDLGPIEEAQAYSKLLERYGATQDELAAMLSRNRSSIANSIRLLTLEPDIKDLLEEQKISRGHAKVLLGMDAGLPRQQLAKLCHSRGLSVRECEKRVQAASGRTAKKRRQTRNTYQETPEIRELRERAEQMFGSAVRIDRKTKTGKGTISVNFFSDDDLERVLAIMGVDTDLS